MCFLAIKKQIFIFVNVKNISQETFYSIEVPIIIFSTEGQLSLCNPYAKEVFKIEDEQTTVISDLFNISDVDELRLFSKAKKGEDSQILVRGKESDVEYLLKCSVKFDYVGDPFCIICTALSQNKVVENEEGNI
jgi:PAS domain-containing protein